MMHKEKYRRCSSAINSSTALSSSSLPSTRKITFPCLILAVVSRFEDGCFSIWWFWTLVVLLMGKRQKHETSRSIHNDRWKYQQLHRWKLIGSYYIDLLVCRQAEVRGNTLAFKWLLIRRIERPFHDHNSNAISIVLSPHGKGLDPSSLSLEVSVTAGDKECVNEGDRGDGDEY